MRRGAECCKAISAAKFTAISAASSTAISTATSTATSRVQDIVLRCDVVM